MSGGAKKAAPRDKSVRYAPTRYEVVATSYINGALQPVGAFVYLPESVKPSKNLRAVGGNQADADEDPNDGNEDAFLGRTVGEVVAELPALTDDELDAYANAEKGGKGRVGVLDAIEKEQASRAK